MTHQEALNIAAQAWDKVKAEDDPPFDQCAQDHKFRLAYKVESVAKTGSLEDDFDHAVQEILSAPPAPASDPEPEKAAEGQGAPSEGPASDPPPAPPEQPKGKGKK